MASGADGHATFITVAGAASGRGPASIRGAASGVTVVPVELEQP